jgi:hypothetical protein
VLCFVPDATASTCVRLHVEQEVHAKIMKAIQRRAKGEAYGITDPLTGEPVIPLEKTPDMAVELTMKEGGAVGERVGLLSGGDPPMHALGTYMLFFADKEVRLIKNGGRWFFLAKYVLSILFWSMNLILSAYAAGDMLTRCVTWWLCHLCGDRSTPSLALLLLDVSLQARRQSERKGSKLCVHLHPDRDVLRTGVDF